MEKQNNEQKTNYKNKKEKNNITESIVSSLSPATRHVYFITISKKRKVTDIEKKSGLHPRTVRKALKQLLDLKLVIRVHDLYDTRSHFYVKAGAL